MTESQQLDPRKAFWQLNSMEQAKATEEEKKDIIMVHPAVVEKCILLMLAHQKGWFVRVVENMKFGAFLPEDQEEAKKTNELYDKAIKPAMLALIERI